ncbi:hypothetical protein RFI_29214, partial [Reticulomyxa filosa]
VEVHLGPLDQGSEFVTRWHSELDSNGLMYTCQNALEYIQRTYQPNLDERIGANYYPTASQAYLCDSTDQYRLATIVNQAHGVATLADGQLELMLHRRTLSNDERGPDEPLNETTHIEPRIYLLYDSSEQVSYLSRRLFERQHYGVTKFYAMSPSILDWTSKYALSWTAANSNYSGGLPNNIHLQDLRYAYNGLGYNQGLILQLQHIAISLYMTHIYFINIKKKIIILLNCRSVNETIDLTKIFDPAVLPVNTVTETTLTANLPLSKLKKLSWTIIDEDGEVRVVNDKPTTSNGT